jgi:hypothetical protein
MAPNKSALVEYASVHSSFQPRHAADCLTPTPRPSRREPSDRTTATSVKVNFDFRAPLVLALSCYNV